MTKGKTITVNIFQQPILELPSGSRVVDYEGLEMPPSFQKGIYVKMTKHSSIRHLPWYVGQTYEMTFEGRLTKSDHKERDHDILNRFAWKPHKKPVLIIAFIDGTNLTRDELEGLESYLIKDAKRMNSGLLNKMKTSNSHKGITHTNIEIVGFESGELACKDKRIGSVKEKESGKMLWKTLGHGDQ